MGVITNCCTSKSIIQSSSISVYSLSGIDSTQNNDIYKDIIPTISDLDQACKFITSKEYYPLLQKKIPKHIISKKICLKLNNKDIMKLINNLYQWILHEEFEKCDESTEKNITLIKDNTKTSLNYVLKELTNTQLDNQKIDIFILQSLTNISIIVQCILFLVNNKSSDNNEFNYNIWENKNIVNEAKVNAFQVAYFLLLTKKKYDKNKKSNDINNENKITNEKKEEINDFYKISIEFAYDIINS